MWKSLKHSVIALLMSIATALATDSPSLDGKLNTRTSANNMPEADSRVYQGVPHSQPVPFIASLQGYVNGRFQHFCAGSLISPTRVASAAHCFYGLNSENANRIRFRAVLGSLRPLESGYSAEFKLRDVVLDRRYTENKEAYQPLKYDFSVIHLPRPVPPSSSIQTVELATTDYYNGLIRASGWGRFDCVRLSQDLLYGDGEIVSKGRCEDIVSEVVETRVTFGQDQVCATFKVPFNGAASGVDMGDSGGPLYAIAGNRYVLIGITSFGFVDNTSCVRYDVPQVFAKVSANRDFLLRVPNPNSAVTKQQHAIFLCLFYLFLIVGPCLCQDLA